MRDISWLLVFLMMLLFIPILFGLAYLCWDISHWLATAVLFIGVSADIIGGFKILDQQLNQT
jgi:membrane-anchored protein YejM (alkaline phosphatase superfamily)